MRFDSVWIVYVRCKCVPIIWLFDLQFRKAIYDICSIADHAGMGDCRVIHSHVLYIFFLFFLMADIGESFS